MENMRKVYAFLKTTAMKKILLTMTSFVLLMIGCSKNDDNNNNNNNNNNIQPGEYPTDSVEPQGAISGLFTINGNGDQVYFSQGNLQYKPSTNTWRFAENQWDLCGNDFDHYVSGHSPQIDSIFHFGNVLGGSNFSLDWSLWYEEIGSYGAIYPTQSKNEWIDAFGWGTSGWPCNLYYQPWESRPFVDDDNVNSGFGLVEESVSYDDIIAHSDSYGPPVSDQDMTGYYADCDWGVYNAISNGGNRKNMWRTLTRGEWDYLLNFRYTSSGIRFAAARISDVLGVIVLPDNWEAIYYPLKSVNRFEDNNHGVYSRNWLDYSEWNILEEHGAVFLPLNMYRWVPSSNGYGDVYLYGSYERGSTDYWTASADGNNRAYTLINVICSIPSNSKYRAYKKEVRLVCPVQK